LKEEQLDINSSERIFAALLAGSALVAGTYVYMGLKTPLPGQDEDVCEGLEVEMHEFITDDGVTLRVKRYANPEGTPVVFFHGFNGNGFEFDIPRRGYNMAEYLARRGYDVWITHFRGCGIEPWRCDDGAWQHSIDTLAIYDAPALIDGVTRLTGRKPFWIGHSMGGMVLYMYLQGVRFEGDPSDFLVVTDPELVEERNSKLLGGVAIASPPAFYWPPNHPYQIVSGSSVGRGVVRSFVLLNRLIHNVAPRVRIGSAARMSVRNNPRGLKFLSRSPIGMLIYNRKNTDSETSTCLVKWGADDVSARMSVQLYDGIGSVNYRQYRPLAFRSDPYDYTTNMPLITAPMLYLVGDKDFVHPEAIKRYGFDRVSSEDKEFVMMPGYGHTDLVMGRNVSEEVYPMIGAWMDRVRTETEGREAG
jgi:lysosomal acid lipase/cholesteryl ester hydrolase